MFVDVGVMAFFDADSRRGAASMHQLPFGHARGHVSRSWALGSISSEPLSSLMTVSH